MTARTPCFFFTSLVGSVFLTLQTMTSPRPATRLRLPPSTLMHITSLAPVLSATSSLDCIWIMAVHRDRPGRLLRGLPWTGLLLARFVFAGFLCLAHFPQLGRRTHRRHVHLLAPRHDPDQVPPLQLRAGRGLDDLDRVAEMRIVLFVVHVTNRAAANVFPVFSRGQEPLDLDAARLVHFVAGDDANDLSLGHGWLSVTWRRPLVLCVG